MNGHKSELIGALLDGELRGWRRLLVTRHVRACPLCAAEYRHQRHVRHLLRANPPTAQMSDSAELFWTKVRREIERRGADPQIRVPAARLGALDWLRQHQLAVASLAAAVVAAVVVFWTVQVRRPAPVTVAAPPRTHLAKVERVSTAIPNTVATAFDAEDEGVAVIWVSGLPWAADMTEMKTLYANLDT